MPTQAELVRRITDLVPVLQKYTDWSEENRRPHDEAIEALAEAGVFRMRTPARYGGYESDTRTLCAVGSELARADGAIAWTASVYWIPTWMAGLFPDPVQDEVFATENARICGTLSPSGMASPADGGVTLSGRWGFISGAAHSHWQVVIAIRLGHGPEPYPVMALVPMSDLQLVDDWHTSGMRGTGSISTVAQDVFVPEERILPLPVVLQGQSVSERNAGSAMYRSPLLPVGSASSVGTLLGLARAAAETFLERLPERKITYTAYDQQRQAPLTHLQVSDALLKIDEAEFHATRLTALVDGKCETGAGWDLPERAKARADLGAVGRLAKDAIDILATASGGSSIYHDVPMQRIARDIQAVTLHALLHPDTNFELYGRVVCGLEPNTLYL